MGKKKTGKNHGTIPPVPAKSVSDVDVLQQKIFGPGKAGHLHGGFHVSNRYCSCSTKAGTSTKEQISVLDGHPFYNKDAQGSAKAFWEDFGNVNENESESSSSVSRTRGLEDTDCDEESCGTPQSVVKPQKISNAAETSKLPVQESTKAPWVNLLKEYRKQDDGIKLETFAKQHGQVILDDQAWTMLNKLGDLAWLAILRDGFQARRL